MDPLLERPWLDWRGLSVTIPHKENALAYVGEMECDELSVAIGAINTISMHTRGRRMQPSGDNTDYSAAIDALCGAMGITRDELAGRQTAVLGAGGAARAIVAALRHYGANVTVHNRTLTRARSLADEFGASAAGDDTAPQAEIIINCTPLGMHPAVDGSPLEAIPQGTRVVFDTIYNPVETRLLRLARQAGCTCISGVEMFVNQAAAQFEIWTNRPAPRDIMRQVVLRQLGARE
jgi:3-dehydroquinate dehydratase/shikimate dehydrogenase